MMYCTGGIRCERASALMTQIAEVKPEFKPQDVYGNFNIIFDDFWRISQFHFIPHVPCAMPNCVSMRIGG